MPPPLEDVSAAAALIPECYCRPLYVSLLVEDLRLDVTCKLHRLEAKTIGDGPCTWMLGNAGVGSKWARGRAIARAGTGVRAGSSNGERRGTGKHGYRLSRDEKGES